MLSQSTNLYNQLAKNKLFKKNINFDLKRIKLALSKLNHPERKLKNVINIIGSDGKYSLLNSLKFFIEANNQKTSAFISPSLKNIRDRFWMGDIYLSYNEIKNSIKIIEKLKINLTVFEVLTLIFIINSANEDNDYNLVEAGALFAKDSTNVFPFPLIQAVVNINKQHLNFLKKKTLNEIINQKVGYLNQFTNIYVGKQNIRTQKKIKKILVKNNSKKIYSNSWKLIKIKKNYFYKDKSFKIKILNKNIHSKGLLDNLAMAIKIALDLGINESIIKKTIPRIKHEGRIDYLKKGKIHKKLYNNEKILIDGCHSENSAKNLAAHLKNIKIPKYGIWGMIKNKDPNNFIKQFKGVFKKIITIDIDREKKSLSKNKLLNIANKNNFSVETAENFESAIKKISSKQKKIICVFGSLYLCGNILNKN